MKDLDNVFNATREPAKTEVCRSSDIFELCRIIETALFSFRLLSIYLLHYKVFYQTLCTTIGSENDEISVKNTAKKINVYETVNGRGGPFTAVPRQ